MSGNLIEVFYILQGANASQLEKEIGSEQFPANEHYFGLVNVSKTIQFDCRVVSQKWSVNGTPAILSRI
jgi:hypothetical protein